MDKLHRVQIKKVLGPTQNGTAVILGTEERTFVMFIGYYEGAALMRELNEEEPARPFTHELLWYTLQGFDIEIARIVITDVIDGVFCATLVLNQKVVDENDQWVGKRSEVRIDARPSDCLILSCKSGADVYCSQTVLEKVRDVTLSGDDGVLFGAEGAEGAEPGDVPTPEMLQQMFDDSFEGEDD